MVESNVQKATLTVTIVYRIHRSDYMVEMDDLIKVFEDGIKDNVDRLSTFGIGTQAIGCKSVESDIKYETVISQ